MRKKNKHKQQAKNNEKSLIEKHQKETQKLKDELAKKEVILSRQKYELSSLNDKVKKMSKDNAHVSALAEKNKKLQERIQELEKELDEQTPILIKEVVNDNNLSNEEVLSILNNEEEQIVMVGGHQALMAKVRQWAPNIEHIESRDYSKEIPAKATIVLLNVSYLNHPMYHRSMTRIEQLRRNHEVKIVYINTQSTNREVLLKEIGSQL